MKDFNLKVSAVFFALLLFSQVLTFKLKDKSQDDAAKNEVQSHSQQKRGAVSAFMKFLAATALVTSVGTLSYSLYLELNGCCKVGQPHFCDKQNELPGFHEEWLKRAEEINDIALTGSLQVTSINSIHTNNEIIRIKLVQIIRNIDQLVETLFDSDLNALLILQNEIDQIYRDNVDKMQSWTADDFNIHFQGVWGDPKGMAILFGPVIFEVGTHILSSALRWNRMRTIQKKVTADLSASILKNTGNQQLKAYKLLQASQYSQTKLIKQTTLARYKASFETGGNFKKAAGSFFSGLVIAFDLWHISEINKECAEVRELIEKNHAEFTTEFANLDQAEIDVNAANVEIQEAYDNLTESISSDEFLVGLENIEDLVRGASTQNTETTADADAIKMFREGIVDAVTNKDNAAIIDLQTRLSESLGRVEYHYDCFLGKATAMRELLTSCQAGRDTLSVLYDEKKNSLGSCILADDGSTPPYLSYTDVETAVIADADKNNYSSNCRLNNANLKILVCTDYCNKYPNTQEIEDDYTLTSTEVTTLCANYLCELTDQEKSTICLFKTVGQPVDVAIQIISASKKAAATAYYNNDC